MVGGLVVGGASCGDDDSSSDGPVTITLLTYDGYVAPDSLKAFTQRTGITVTVATSGDAGTLVNKAILTKGKPEGDVIWGIDNTLLSRATTEDGFLIPYESPELANLTPAVTALVPGHEVTPVDTGDVCLNYDKAWFAQKGLAPPASFEDLANSTYKDLLVVENPATSTPGLAFLLATVAKFGTDGYAPYWQQLKGNGVRVVEDWTTAYYTDFTAGGGGGDRPIVVSYASSPPATIVFATDPKPTEPTTGVVDSTCLRQVEFAGILDGTDHERQAKQLIDFMLSAEFQAELPLTNFVYPVRQGVALPDVFVQFGQPVASPLEVSPEDIAAHRDEWISTWTATVLG
jgi:thiamine transport system substrate-binding protein